MSTLKRIAGSSAALFTTADLNSLANGSSILSDEYDNGTNLWLFADLEFQLDFAVAPTDNAIMELWLIPAEDGTNYADGSASVPARSTLSIGTLPVDDVSTAQRLVVRNIQLPSCKFKILVKNSSGQALGASGNEMTIFPNGLQTI